MFIMYKYHLLIILSLPSCTWVPLGMEEVEEFKTKTRSGPVNGTREKEPEQQKKSDKNEKKNGAQGLRNRKELGRGLSNEVTYILLCTVTSYFSPS